MTKRTQKKPIAKRERERERAGDRQSLV